MISRNLTGNRIQALTVTFILEHISFKPRRMNYNAMHLITISTTEDKYKVPKKNWTGNQLIYYFGRICRGKDDSCQVIKDDILQSYRSTVWIYRSLKQKLCCAHSYSAELINKQKYYISSWIFFPLDFPFQNNYWIFCKKYNIE